MALSNEMQERLTYERNLNLKLQEGRRSLEAAVDLHQQEIDRLRRALDQEQIVRVGLEESHKKMQQALVEISRNRIHGKATVAAAVATDALK